MKKSNLFAFLVLLIMTIVAALNFLYIVDIISFRWVSVGVFVISITNLLNLIVHKKDGGPFYHKNWRNNPKLTVLFCICMLALTATFFVAIFHAY